MCMFRISSTGYLQSGGSWPRAGELFFYHLFDGCISFIIFTISEFLKSQTLCLLDCFSKFLFSPIFCLRFSLYFLKEFFIFLIFLLLFWAIIFLIPKTSFT